MTTETAGGMRTPQSLQTALERTLRVVNLSQRGIGQSADLVSRPAQGGWLLRPRPVRSARGVVIETTLRGEATIPRADAGHGARGGASVNPAPPVMVDRKR